MTTDRFQGTARELGGIVQETAGRITGDRVQQARGLGQQAAGIAQNARGQVRERFEEAVEASSDLARDARETLAGTARTVQDRATRAYADGRSWAESSARAVEHRIEDHPLMSLAVAGAVGYLLSLLVQSRR